MSMIGRLSKARLESLRFVTEFFRRVGRCVTYRDLAASFNTTRPGAFKMLKSLERAGLVKRTPDGVLPAWNIPEEQFDRINVVGVNLVRMDSTRTTYKQIQLKALERWKHGATIKQIMGEFKVSDWWVIHNLPKKGGKRCPSKETISDWNVPSAETSSVS